ncbi:TPA: XRE family transcriptional regulator [Citrobacter freundii]|uniref:XRE family transcriptional regulator n=1 Tax=Enterobacteriaceae TaxID=543 RepID=UPI0012EF6F1A|nr:MULTISPECIES: helix-turn-helix transcriptional regulator [Enterobacteriaceae]EDG5032414.1 helix-turn-helix domain-containing protein [Salmonella enterica subsp. enterica serovar Bovismorbificans]EAW5735678.1 helix-turn-helix transcriptional regulator [Salmonella enterica]EEO7693590.1 helix-turn-helix transcriptional regulator [Salmonella enterica subsp. enterica serovar Bovismorbificans]EJD3719744.1 helix-turn-helix transcriptional regulator [Salmonella enterica]EKI2826078.1 helix-turn-heli
MSGTTFSDRLRDSMQKAGLTQSQLAEAVGVSQGAIQKLVSGKAKSTTKLVQIANVLGVRPEWLSEGVGAIRKSDDFPPEEKWTKVETWDSKTPLEDDEVEVPFLKDIEFACGSGRVMEEDYNGYKLRFSKSTLRRVGASTDGSGIICFPAAGNSMEPLIPDGTTVAVNIEDKKIVDGKIYAINQEGWKRIKLLYRTGPDEVTIRSYNTDEYPDEVAKMSSVEVVGRVFWTSTVWN